MSGINGVESKIKKIVRDNLENWEIPSNLKIFKDAYLDSISREINILTLNHDREFEKYFDSENIKFMDGFVEEVTNHGYDKGYKFNIDNFSIINEKKSLNLLKLHGSTDWYEYGNVHTYKIGDKNIIPDDPLLMMGTYNKLESYNLGIFKDIFSMFLNKLDLSDILIISGYGFQDKWINIYINAWLYKSAQNKLIIIHPDKEKLINEDLRETFIHNSFNTLYYSGKLIYIPSEFHKVNWEELKQHIL